MTTQNPKRFPRRAFPARLALGAAAVAGASRTFTALSAEPPSQKLVTAVVGLGRGLAHLQALLAQSNVEVAYVCDVDTRRWAPAMGAVRKFPDRREPTPVQDLRRILDDKQVDAVFIATPNHWHAVASILACEAGKHVYVEKPGSHNAREAEWMVQAARHHRRVVQMGNQRRSWPAIIEAVQRLRGGIIGRLRSARCHYVAARPSMGRGRGIPTPSELDFSLWQGAAPEQRYRDNFVHYNWHWLWHWGGGELANNGIHALDIARWGLGVELPHRVQFGGGRYHFEDDQETPDTGVALFDYGDRLITWDVSSCHPRTSDRAGFVTFYGDGGVLEMDGGAGYVVRDINGKEVESRKGTGGEAGHIENFLRVIRGRGRLASDIADGQTSTLLCHLGNIAWRTQSTLRFDPDRRVILDHERAVSLWGREYRNGWEETLRKAAGVVRIGS